MLRLGWEPDYAGRICISSNDHVARLNEVIAEAAEAGLVAVDTETTGLNVLEGARMFMYSFAYFVPDDHPDGRLCPVGGGKMRKVRSVSVFVGTRHKADDTKVDEGAALSALQELFSTCRVVFFNAKFDLKILWADGVQTRGASNDAFLDLFVIDSGFGDSIPEVKAARKRKELSENAPLPRNLKDLCRLLLLWPAGERDEVKAWLTSKFGGNNRRWKYEHLPRDIVATYACGDVERTLCLQHWAAGLLAEREQTELATMESELVSVVAAMELNGVVLNTAAATTTRAQWQQAAESATDAMLEQTGLTTCDYGTDEWLTKFAWPALNRRAGKQCPIPTGWSADDLSHYATKARGKGIDAVPEAGLHGLFCKALLERRLADKVLGTYIDPWLNEHGVEHEDGLLRLHADLNQTGAGTGRFSCLNPNLQNVPMEARLLTAPPGRSLVFIDYSQIEYRVFAHYAGGDVMTAYQNDPRVDFHQIVAELMQVPRKAAKNLNFGMLYGMGREALVNNLRVLCGMNEADAMRTFNLYHVKFPAARSLYNRCEQRARERGYVRNLAGRRRYLTSDQARKALNSLVQGGAADVVKRAMLRVNTWLLANPERAITMNLQIHDELIFECPAGAERALVADVAPLMTAEPLLKVPLIVEAEYIAAGELWMNKRKLH